MYIKQFPTFIFIIKTYQSHSILLTTILFLKISITVNKFAKYKIFQCFYYIYKNDTVLLLKMCLCLTLYNIRDGELSCRVTHFDNSLCLCVSVKNILSLNIK